MNGCLIPDTPIVVDFWKKVSNPFSKFYFLSHMHSDHTQGLSASWRWEIYCSAISARLLIDKFQIKDHLVRPLELGQSHIIPLDHVAKETMTVTLFDANHCPGSVMFLFEGYFGRILYTGDFRYKESTFPTEYFGPEHPIDKLYLDNTFNSPRCTFPSRAECKEKILDIVAGHPDHEVVLGMYTLGKEDLLEDIAITFKTRVVVGSIRMRSIQLLELLDVFTTDRNEGRVRLVPPRAISKRNMAKWNEDIPTIAIIPTGLFSALDGKPYANQNNVYIVPYSDHSSYPELRQFVSEVRPRIIIPIVKKAIVWNTNLSITDIHNFDDLLDKTPFVSRPVVQFMSNIRPEVTPSRESRSQSNIRVELRNPRRSGHRAMGVVFQDDDQEQNQKTALMEGLKSKQLSPLTTNLIKACHSQTLNSRKVKSNGYFAGQGVHQDVSLVPSKVTTIEIGTPSKERNHAHVGGKGEPTSLHRRPLFLSENVKVGTMVTLHQSKENCVAKDVKQKRPNIEKRKRTEGQEADLILSGSMSTKKRRVLPEFCSSTPEPVKLVHSGSTAKIPAQVKLTLSRNIEDYFRIVGSPRDTDSKQGLCKLSTENEVVVGVCAKSTKLHSQPEVHQACHKHQTEEIHEQKWEQPKPPKCKLNGMKEECVSTSSKEHTAAVKYSRSSVMPHVRVKPMKLLSAGHRITDLEMAFQNFFAKKVK